MVPDAGGFSLNVTSTHIEDDSNVATLYLTTTQAVVNPVPCSATDGYEADDPVTVQEMLAITLTAMSLGSTVQNMFRARNASIIGRI